MASPQDNRGVHPYLHRKFYSVMKDHFWENDKYTEAGKKYYRDLLQAELKDNERLNKEDQILWKIRK